MPLYDPGAGKRPINLSLNADLVAKARAEGFNLSALAKLARERFAEEVRRCVAEHEECLAQYGNFADAVRAADADAP